MRRRQNASARASGCGSALRRWGSLSRRTDHAALKERHPTSDHRHVLRRRATTIREPTSSRTSSPFRSYTRNAPVPGPVRPDAAKAVRDIWPNHIWECSRRGSHFWRTPRCGNSARLRYVAVVPSNVVTTSHPSSRSPLTQTTSVGSMHVTIAPVGETGDQVLQRSESEETSYPPSVLRRNRSLRWQQWRDEEVLIPTVRTPAADPGILLILVPHEPSEPALGSGKRAGGRCRRSDSRASATITTNSHRRQRRHSHGAVSLCGRRIRGRIVQGNVRNLEPAVSASRSCGPGAGILRKLENWPAGKGFIVNDTQDLYRFFDRLRDPKERCGRSGILALCVNTPAPQASSGYLEPILWPKESKGRGSK